MDLENAVRTIRQLREALAVISEHAGEMTPQAMSAVAGLAVIAADKALSELRATP